MSEQTSNRYMVIEEVAGAAEPDTAAAIAIESWEWGASIVADDPGTGAQVYGMSITREVDWASPRLLRLFETGTTVARATLYEYSTTSTGRVLTTQIGLTDMTVVHYRGSASDPGGSHETFGLRFPASVVRYPPRNSAPVPLN
jgi:type VI protein secretion system component Hcp